MMLEKPTEMAGSQGSWMGTRAFNEWRGMLGRIGQCEVDESTLTEAEKLGDWDDTPEDCLTVLLVLEPDGHILARDALVLACRLRRLLEHDGGFTLSVPMGWSLREFARVTESFADGLEAAYDAREPLEFH